MQQAFERGNSDDCSSCIATVGESRSSCFPLSLRKGWRWALREKEELGGKAGGEQKKAAEEGGDRKGGGRRRVAFPFWRRRHRRQQSSSLPFMPLCLSPLPSPAEPFVLRRPPPPPPPPQPERERERRPALALFPGDVLGGGDWTGDDGGGGSPFSRKPSLSRALKRRRRKLAFAEPVSASVEERKMSVLEDGLERRKNRELAFAFREGHPNF